MTKFNCGCGSTWLMWVKMNIIRNEEAEGQNGHVDDVFMCTLKRIRIMTGFEMKELLDNSTLKVNLGDKDTECLPSSHKTWV